MNQNDATPAIREQNEALQRTLPFDDTRDFAAADRGFLGSPETAITGDDGHVVWDNTTHNFLEGDAPATVNPSLWRQSRLVAKQGLYEVVAGIYQARGFDLSNITFVESDSGVIVIDPLISKETAAAALTFYREKRGDRAVRAVIYTHSHIDHFGGVLGVTTKEEVASGAVPIIAPAEFLQHSIDENVYPEWQWVAERDIVRRRPLTRTTRAGGRGPWPDPLDGQPRSHPPHPRDSEDGRVPRHRWGADRVRDGTRGRRGERKSAWSSLECSVTCTPTCTIRHCGC